MADFLIVEWYIAYIELTLKFMITRYHHNLKIVFRSSLPESEMRNRGVDEITDITGYDEDIANRFQRH